MDVDTTRTRHARRGSRWAVAAPVAFAAFGLVAASCGGSTSHAAGSGNGTGAGAYGAAGSTGTSAPAARAAIDVGHTPLGSILTDGRGRTVYLFEKDTGTASTCSGACAAVWPPVTTTATHPMVTNLADQALLGTTTRTDGTTQLTYAGHPLYFFAGDLKAGDTTGQGLQNFGGGWYVVSPTGQKIEQGG